MYLRMLVLYIQCTCCRALVCTYMYMCTFTIVKGIVGCMAIVTIPGNRKGNFAYMNGFKIMIELTTMYFCVCLFFSCVV